MFMVPWEYPTAIHLPSDEMPTVLAQPMALCASSNGRVAIFVIFFGFRMSHSFTSLRTVASWCPSGVKAN